MPDHGLLVNVVAPRCNAAIHGLKPGDVLLAYNGIALNKKDDLKVIADGDKPIAVDVWRDGRSSQRDLAAGKFGEVIDSRPAPVAIAENRKLQQVLVAARGGRRGLRRIAGHTVRGRGTRARLFHSDDRPTRTLLAADASEPELDRLASSGELARFGFIHLATHGVIDEAVPARSAVILTQSGEGFVGFTQALLMSGTRSVCLSLWKVDDTATALLMQRFYANLLGKRPGLTGPLPKAEALREAKVWLCGLRRAEVLAVTAELSGGVARSKGAKAGQPDEFATAVPFGGDNDRPYAPPYFWAAFVLAGDPE